MKAFGLTGGIATGKSTVSRFFTEAGARVIDADRIARDMVVQGRPEWRKIVDRFGESILLPNGDIDRVRLGDIVFNDPDARSALNQIVHPPVFDEINRTIDRISAESPDTVIILDVPLLIESGMKRDLALVILVYTSPEIQLQRLMNRDEIPEKDALARIQSQMPIDAKKQYADMVIDNSGSVEQTRNQTFHIYENLKTGVCRWSRR